MDRCKMLALMREDIDAFQSMRGHHIGNIPRSVVRMLYNGGLINRFFKVYSQPTNAQHVWIMENAEKQMRHMTNHSFTDIIDNIMRYIISPDHPHTRFLIVYIFWRFPVEFKFGTHAENQSNSSEENQSNASDENQSNASEENQSNASEENQSNASDENQSNASEENQSNASDHAARMQIWFQDITWIELFTDYMFDLMCPSCTCRTQYIRDTQYDELTTTSPREDIDIPV